MSSFPWRCRHRAGVLIFGLLAAAGAAAAAPSGFVAPLQKAHTESSDALKGSPFGKPLTISSTEGKGRLEGTVRAVVEQPYGEVRKTLAEPARWCELLLLIPNIASCSPEQGELKVGLVKRFDAKPASATPIRFTFKPQSSEQGLRVALSADKGPVGTRDYEIELGAIPVDGGKTFLQLRYAYAYGASARFAAKAYLSTSGSSKVGFSDGGKIGGLRGALERNAMRYYLAIDAQLAAAAERDAGKRYAASLQHWLKAIEPYPQQLKEDDPKAYSAAKLRNFAARADAG